MGVLGPNLNPTGFSLFCCCLGAGVRSKAGKCTVVLQGNADPLFRALSLQATWHQLASTVQVAKCTAIPLY